MCASVESEDLQLPFVSLFIRRRSLMETVVVIWYSDAVLDVMAAWGYRGAFLFLFLLFLLFLLFSFIPHLYYKARLSPFILHCLIMLSACGAVVGGGPLMLVWFDRDASSPSFIFYQFLLFSFYIWSGIDGLSFYVFPSALPFISFLLSYCIPRRHVTRFSRLESISRIVVHVEALRPHYSA